MKKFLAFIMAVICVFSFSGCGVALTAKKIIPDSDIYSKAEIKSAMNKVMRHFAFHFEGCILLELEYDEEYSRKRADDLAENYDAYEAMVLLSEFYVLGDNPSLAKGETYKKWNWILVREKYGFWELKDWGYG